MNTLRCPNCSKEFSPPAGLVGKCPECGISVTVPPAEPVAVAAVTTSEGAAEEKLAASRRAWLGAVAVMLLLGAGIGFYWEQLKQQLTSLGPQAGPATTELVRGQPGPEPVDPVLGTGQKYALAVGINRYQHEKLTDLQYAVNDAAKLGEVLSRAGFAVTVLSDDTGKSDPRKQPTKVNVERSLDEILQQCQRGDIVVVALAGHGLQFEKKSPDEPDDSYFCPQDARPFRDQRATLVSLGKIYQQLDRSFAGMKVLLVDACRDDPDQERGTRGVNADFAARPPQGVAALFSCRAGERAYENAKLEHGVFFYHVIQGLRGEAQDQTKEVTFAGLAAYVNRAVPKWLSANIPGARQSPNLKADYSTEPVLVRHNAAAGPPASTPPVTEVRLLALADMTLEPGQSKSIPVRVERRHYQGPIELRLEGLPAGVQATTATILTGSDTAPLPLMAAAGVPEGKHSVRLVALAADARAEATLALTITTSAPVREISNSIGMKLALIPAGSFRMGSPRYEEGRFDNEEQHEVEITRPYYLGVCEVTRGQFARFVADAKYRTEAERDGLGGWGYDAATGTFKGPKYHADTHQLEGPATTYSWRDPGFAQTDDHPVVNVSWNDAVAFCAWLSQKEGQKYRLPTEAEWEYAARANMTTRFWSGHRDQDLQGAGNVADASYKAKDSAGTWAQPWDDGYPFTAPVGQFRANGFGLHDMHGNVWEWCADWYEKDYQRGSRQDPQGPSAGSSRVQRGGSFFNPPKYCRAAYRLHDAPAYRDDILGFRIVLIR